MNQRIPIIAYHDVVNRRQFEQQIMYFSKKFTFISVWQLEQYFTLGLPLPPKPLLVTFDDAYPSVYYHGLEVLVRYKVPAMVFVITGLVGTDQPYWWDEIIYYAPPEWSDTRRKKQLWEVKNWSNIERLAYLKTLREASGRSPLHRNQLNWRQLQEMEDAGITLANHTHDHPMLDRCTAEEVDHSILTGASILAERGCSGSRFFAYPNGNPSTEATHALRTASTSLAFLFDHQLTDLSADRLRLSRLSMNTENSLLKTRLILSGLHSSYLNLKKRIAS